MQKINFLWSLSILGSPYSMSVMFHFSKDSALGDDEEEGTSGEPNSKRLKVEPEKKKERKCQKVDEDEIQKMQ